MYKQLLSVNAYPYAEIILSTYLNMSFIGQDWRSPGDKWIRTEFGWKRLADIRYELNVHQVASQRGRTSTGLRLPRSEPKPPSALNVNGHSDTNGVQNWSEASAPQVSRYMHACYSVVGNLLHA